MKSKALDLFDHFKNLGFYVVYADHGNGIETVHLKGDLRETVWDSDPVFRFEGDEVTSFKASERTTIDVEG